MRVGKSKYIALDNFPLKIEAVDRGWYVISEREEGLLKAYGLHQERISELEEKLETARKALEDVTSLVTCHTVYMSGECMYRFMTSRQNEVIHHVKNALIKIDAILCKCGHVISVHGNGNENCTECRKQGKTCNWFVAGQ